MKRREFNKILTLSSLTPLTFYNTAKANNIWSLKADISESCACDIPCPCNFGRPTEKKCNGNRLIEINEGYLENENLNGIKFVVTFEMGKWSRIYIDNQNGSDQVRITEKILPKAFSGFFNQAEVIKSEALKISKNKSVSKAIGIVEIKDFIKKKMTEGEVIDKISIKTRQYAKRQVTWARGHMINWKKIKPKRLNIFIKKI